MKNNSQEFEKKIGDNTYKVIRFKGRTALRIKHFIIKLFAPALARLTGAIDRNANVGKKVKNITDLLNSDLRFEKIAEAIEHLFMSLSEDQFLEAVERLLSETFIVFPGKSPIKFNPFDDNVFDLAFGGELLSLWQLIIFILEVNFPDFFALTKDFGSPLQTLLSSVEEEAKKEL
ncbi:MAG: phage tail assembly chaperone [Candidatus Hodarchaeota archaeon]